MKKLCLFLLSLTAVLAVGAQSLTATIQHDGQLLGAYDGVNAFRDAYEAAPSGATITLAPGTYDALESAVDKQLTIVGSGAFEDGSITKIASLAVSVDDVRLEGLYISGTLTLGAVGNCRIVRCWIDSELQSSEAHHNTLLDQCVVRKNYAMTNAVEFYIKNSTIGNIDTNTSSNPAEFVNTVIYYWQTSSGEPYGVYRNCALSADLIYGNVSLPSASEFYNTAFSTTYLYNRYNSWSNNYLIREPNVTFGSNAHNCYKIAFSDLYQMGSVLSGDPMLYPASLYSPPTGDDGRPIGIEGGTGFSTYPAIPRITSSTIDATTNDQGQIHVSISAEITQ